MKFLTLIRHAKSNRDDSQVSDHDRGLADRGVHDCPVMAFHIAQVLPVPERILVSSARRAVETIDRLHEELSRFGTFPEKEIEQDQYLADAVDIRRIAEELLSGHDDVWICAHNPGITEAVEYCTRSRIDNVPTLGIVRIAFDGNLSEGTLVFLDMPKNHR